MTYNIDYIKDIFNNNFLGIKIRKSEITKYLTDLHTVIGGDMYDIYTSNQQRRDNPDNDPNYGYHITVVSVADYNKLFKANSVDFLRQVDLIFNMPIKDLVFKGIGTASLHENTTYFIVCESNTINDIIQSIGLSKRDLHITIGFDKKDVFGVAKNKVIKINTKFTAILNKKRSEYDDNSFIFKIKNFDKELMDDVGDIKIVSIDDTKMKVVVKSTEMIISEVDDDLRVVAQYNVKEG